MRNDYLHFISSLNCYGFNFLPPQYIMFFWSEITHAKKVKTGKRIYQWTLSLAEKWENMAPNTLKWNQLLRRSLREMRQTMLPVVLCISLHPGWTASDGEAIEHLFCKQSFFLWSCYNYSWDVVQENSNEYNYFRYLFKLLLLVIAALCMFQQKNIDITI